MSIFSLIGKVYSGVVTGAANVITGGLEKITGKKYGRTTAKEFREEPVGKALTTAATIATSALAVVTLPKTLPVLAKTAIKKPIASLAVAGIVSTAGGRLLLEKSAEGVYQGGKALGEAAEAAEKKGKELSLGEALKTAGVAGLGIAVGATIPSIVEKAKDVLGGASTLELPAEVSPEKQLLPEKPVGAAEIAPTAPTTTITTGERRYKRRRAKISPAVRQSVRVNIINQPRHSQTIKYLNARILA